MGILDKAEAANQVMEQLRQMKRAVVIVERNAGECYRAWLEELGTPISVQKRAMRHGDIRVTMNVYGDPVNDALRDASSKIAERAISQLLTKSAT
jgi:hypothetical protein